MVEKLFHTKESCHIWTHFKVCINRIIIPPFSYSKNICFLTITTIVEATKNYNFNIWGCHFVIIGYNWIVKKPATFNNTLDPARMMMCPQGSCLHGLGFYDPLGIRVELVQVLHVCIIIEATFTCERDVVSVNTVSWTIKLYQWLKSLDLKAFISHLSWFLMTTFKRIAQALRKSIG